MRDDDDDEPDSTCDYYCDEDYDVLMGWLRLDDRRSHRRRHTHPPEEQKDRDDGGNDCEDDTGFDCSPGCDVDDDDSDESYAHSDYGGRKVLMGPWQENSSSSLLFFNGYYDD